MDRRRALAATAAITLSITGVAVAVGATTQVFTAADASPNVGRVSPVVPSTEPTVERHVVDVVDPAPVATAPAPPSAGPARVDTRAPAPPVPAPTAVVAPAPATSPAADAERADDHDDGHEREEHQTELDDD